MRLRIDIRIHAKGDRCTPAEAARHPVDAGELGFGLEVEAAYAALEREPDLVRGLADARKENLGGIGAGGEHARELPCRDDVEPGAATCEQREQREAGIGLDRIADEGIVTLE